MADVGNISASVTADNTAFLTALDKCVQSTEQFSKSIEKEAAKSASAFETVSDAASAVSTRIKRVFSGVAFAQVFYKTTQAVVEATEAVWDYCDAVSMANVMFTNFLGDAEDAVNLTNVLQEYASQSPFDFADLTEATKTMKAYGIEEENMMYLMKAIGQVAAATGEYSETFRRVSLALGQISATGRMTSRDMMQLSNAGVNVNEVFKRLGTNWDTVGNDMIDASTAINTIVDVINDELGGSVEAANKTIKGACGNIKDSLLMAANAIVGDYYDKIREAIYGIAQQFEVFQQTFIQSNLEDALIAVFGPELVSKIEKLINVIVQTAEALGNILDPIIKIVGMRFDTFMTVLSAAITLMSNVLTPVANFVNKLLECKQVTDLLTAALTGLAIAWVAQKVASVAATAAAVFAKTVSLVSSLVENVTIALQVGAQVYYAYRDAVLAAYVAEETFISACGGWKKILTTLIGVVAGLALAFFGLKEVTESFLGAEDDLNDFDISDMMKQINQATGDESKYNNAVSETADNIEETEKAAKKAVKALLGFDEVYQVTQDTTSVDSTNNPTVGVDVTYDTDGALDDLKAQLDGFTNDAQNLFDQLAEWFKNLDWKGIFSSAGLAEALNILKNVLDACLREITELLQKYVNLIGTWMGVLTKKLETGFKNLSKQMNRLLGKGGIYLLPEGINSASKSLSSAVAAFGKALEKLPKAITKQGKLLTKGIKSLTKAAKELPKAITEQSRLLKSAVSDFNKQVKALPEALPKQAKKLTTGTKTYTTAVKALTDGVKDATTTLKKKVTSFNKQVKALPAAISTEAKNVTTNAKTFTGNIKTHLLDKIDTQETKFSTLADTFKSDIKSLPKAFGDEAKNVTSNGTAFSNALDGIKGKISAGATKISNSATSVGNAVKGIPKSLKSAIKGMKASEVTDPFEQYFKELEEGFAVIIDESGNAVFEEVKYFPDVIPKAMNEGVKSLNFGEFMTVLKSMIKNLGWDSLKSTIKSCLKGINWKSLLKDTVFMVIGDIIGNAIFDGIQSCLSDDPDDKTTEMVNTVLDKIQGPLVSGVVAGLVTKSPGIGIASAIMESISDAFDSGDTTKIENSCSSMLSLAVGKVTTKMNGGKGVGLAGVIGGLGSEVVTEVTDGISTSFEEEGDEQAAQVTDEVGGCLSSALSWGSMGAAIGSVVPGLGTGVGAAIGAVAGIAIPLISNHWDDITGWFSNTFAPALQTAFSAIGGFFSDIWGGICNFFSGVGDTIGNICGAIGDFFGNLVDVLSTPFQVIGQLFDDFKNCIEQLGGFSEFMNQVAELGCQKIDEFFSFLKQVWDDFVENVFSAIQAVLQWFQDLPENISKLVGTITSAVGNFFSGIANGIQSAWDGICTFFTNIGDFFKNLPETISNLVSTVTTAVGDFFAAIPGAIQTVWDNICGFFSDVGDFFKNLPETITNLVETIGEAVGNFFKAIPGKIEEIFTSIQEWFASVGDFFLNLPETITNLVGTIGEAVGSFIQAIPDKIGEVIDNIKKAFTNIGKWFSDLPTNITNLVSDITKAIGDFFGGLWDGMTSKVSEIWEFIKSIPSKIIGFFTGEEGDNGDAKTWLQKAGENVLGGFQEGLKKIWTGICDFIGGIGDWIVEHKGPENYDKNLLVNAGENIMGGLSDGLQSGFGGVTDFVSGIGDTIAGLFDSGKDTAADAVEGFFGASNEKAKKAVTTFAGYANDMQGDIEEMAAAPGLSKEDMANNSMEYFNGLQKIADDAGIPLDDDFAQMKKEFVQLAENPKTSKKDLAKYSDEYFTKLTDEAAQGAEDSKSPFDDLKDMFTNLPDTISGKVKDVKDAGKDFLGGLWKGIKEKFKDIKDFFANIWDTIWNAMTDNGKSDPGTWLVDTGKSILEGLWDGITGALSWLGDKLGTIGNFIVEHKGPESYDRQLLVPTGGWIMEGLEQGFEDSLPHLAATLASITSDIEDSFAATDVQMNVSAMPSATPASMTPAQPAVVDTLNQMMRMMRADSTSSASGSAASTTTPVYTDTTPGAQPQVYVYNMIANKQGLRDLQRELNVIQAESARRS